MKHISVLLVFLFTSVVVYCQEEEKEEEKHHHQISLVLGHSHVSEGVTNQGKTTFLILPSWGLDYNFWINEKWGLGIHTDIIVENFVVESLNEEEFLERTTPFSLSIVGLYKFTERFSVLLGLGEEFSKEENFFMIRGGVEYGVEIKNGYEFNVSLMNDFKINAYDSWFLGFGISKFF